MNKVLSASKLKQFDKLDQNSPVKNQSNEASRKNFLSDMQKEMIDLYHSIESVLPDKKNRIVQFISSKTGEGTTTLTKAFAKISAEIFDNSVLLIDTSLPKSKSIYTLSNTIERNGLKSILSNQVQINQFFQRDKENQFYVFPILSVQKSLSSIFNSQNIVELFGILMEKFDYILIDSPPASVTSEGFTIARKVDGVVIVMEAESTRWPIVKSLKNNIEKVGGNCLGVILNKQRHYIPSFIYKQL